MSKPVTNLAASVKQRLLTLSRERKEDFNLLLTKYALERLLFRIGQSSYQKIFVLKGALLFELWTKQAHRPTRDADFLSDGDSNPHRFETIFKEICVLSVVDDVLLFDPESVTAQRIKEDADYEGVRVTFMGYLDKARIPMQIDIGFGDAVTPDAVEASFPTILDGPMPMLFAYPKETVVAEKFEAAVKLGIANSRMKDFHDLRALAELFSFEGEILSLAIARTFERRKTTLPQSAPPLAFTAEFFDDPSKKAQWTAFSTKNKLYIKPETLEDVMSIIRSFLMPLIAEIGKEYGFKRSWKPGGPWLGT